MPDANLPPDRKTLRLMTESNNALREAVEYNNKLLEPLLDGFEDLKDSHRRNVVLSGLLVVALIVVSGLGWWFIDEQHDAQVAGCRIANDRVERERVWWRDAYFEVTKESAKQQGFEPGSPVYDYYVELEEYRLTDLLPLRDCTDLDKQLPEWGAPPDFREALKQALEEEKR